MGDNEALPVRVRGGGALVADEPAPASDGPVLSRRALLRDGSLALGGLGAATFLAACGAPSGARPAWTYGPALAPTTAAGTEPPAGPTGPPPTPAGSAAAPSPAASAVAARDPSPADFAVPPRYRPHVTAPVEFTLTAHDGPGQAILISATQAYNSMNFGQVPAPTLRLTEGDVVRFTLTNAGSMSHSIDFHAAQTPWSTNYQDVKAGSSFSFDWTARHAGVFMYHCGTSPVLMHIGDGMYGAIIVDPKDGRPKAREYLLVQSEFYGTGGDYKAMLSNPPDVVCFNAQAFRYKTTPLIASVGELVRIFIMNAGPNSTSAFHVIGELFDAYEPEGNPANRLAMHQTIGVPPGDGALVELTFDAAGTYPFVSHRFSDAERGAVGLIEVS